MHILWGEVLNSSRQMGTSCRCWGRKATWFKEQKRVGSTERQTCMRETTAGLMYSSKKWMKIVELYKNDGRKATELTEYTGQKLHDISKY